MKWTEFSLFFASCFRIYIFRCQSRELVLRVDMHFIICYIYNFVFTNQIHKEVFIQGGWILRVTV